MLNINNEDNPYPTGALIEETDHEQIVFCKDEGTGLRCIIALHDTSLGPALGGVRMWNYNSESAALLDVLRLSRGMTYKNALAGLNAGGGKAVIIGDPSTQKTEPLLRRFGKFVNGLSGRYVTAEDMSMTPEDMEHIAVETRHATGLAESSGGLGGPSPVTAYGTYLGIKAAAKNAYGSDKLEGLSVAIQGVGHVGEKLIEYLEKEQSKIIVTDLSENRLKYIAREYKVEVVGQDDIYDVSANIFSPNAMGAILNNYTIPRLKSEIIAGAANNQLEDEATHAEMLKKRGILYVPDFAINAGGVINVFMEYQGGKTSELSFQKAEKIYGTCANVLEMAYSLGITTHEAAIELARNRIDQIGKIKLSH